MSHICRDSCVFWALQSTLCVCVCVSVCVSVCMCVCGLSSSVTSNSFVTPLTVAHQAPLFMEFSWQKYGNGLPFLPQGDLLNPGSQRGVSCISCTGRQILYHRATWEAQSSALYPFLFHCHTFIRLSVTAGGQPPCASGRKLCVARNMKLTLNPSPEPCPFKICRPWGL